MSKKPLTKTESLMLDAFQAGINAERGARNLTVKDPNPSRVPLNLLFLLGFVGFMAGGLFSTLPFGIPYPDPFVYLWWSIPLTVGSIVLLYKVQKATYAAFDRMKEAGDDQRMDFQIDRFEQLLKETTRKEDSNGE